MDKKGKKNSLLRQTTPLHDLQEQLKSTFKLPEIITNSPFAEMKKISKHFSEIGKVPYLIPEVSTKSILDRLSGVEAYESIIVQRSPWIPPLSAPEEFHTELPNPSPATITSEVYHERTPLERHRVPSPKLSSIKIPKKVIIVGGRTDGTNHVVAIFIKKLGMKAIILDEQPNGGRTSMEKLEAYADADFAIVLLTADDVGASKDNPDELKPRPSQDTMFEFIYLSRELRPEQVCTLYREEIELTSYIDGWIHVAMDSGDGWRLKLLREMEYAGLPIDLNNLP